MQIHSKSRSQYDPDGGAAAGKRFGAHSTVAQDTTVDIRKEKRHLPRAQRVSGVGAGAKPSRTRRTGVAGQRGLR